jgi:hypothetical protein
LFHGGSYTGLGYRTLWRERAEENCRGENSAGWIQWDEFLPEYTVDFPFQAVYHVTTLNHWKDIAQEQLGLVLANRRLQALTVTIANTPEADLPFLQMILLRAMERRPELKVVGHFCELREFEHPAMKLVDQVARQEEMPVLYFHMKGVSFTPPDGMWEKWRRYLNGFLGEADRWAEFLGKMPYDVCGPLLTTDEKHSFRYFAGNFWMARAQYLRGLPAYGEFLEHPKTEAFGPGDRHLAEIAVNRTQGMRGYAVDGKELKHDDVLMFLATLK